MLVVKERADDLLLDRFFLVTSLEPEQMSRQEVLDHYRERGTAEGHMGELKDVLAPALSSTNRPKSHSRGRKPQTATPAVDAFACNEVRLLIALPHGASTATHAGNGHVQAAVSSHNPPYDRAQTLESSHSACHHRPPENNAGSGYEPIPQRFPELSKYSRLANKP